ncbi:MAG: exonuclease SbcCD subunit D [Pyrinomonadaceae bacterium MAG19_C2-C3]|nr:exonuclease SbcCD subunit D [Pyrinomonadaceae bacterium MAG19_C2-C3]
MKFLHLADTHLGCRRYNLDERTKDFARAWFDIVTRHAIGRRVDFVLIAGDFFNSRLVDSQTMNHAMIGLQALRDADIPVIVIEGNHDKHDVVTDHSWLRSLSKWRLIKLLEPVDAEGNQHLAWDETERAGWYIDIKNARIFGSHWYGMSANYALPLLADALKEARDPERFNILMLHTDVEGQLGRPIPALSVARLKELRELVDYVALGHTHKRFELDNWAFNPGSPEWCSTDEYREERGFYLVEVNDARRATVEYIQDYAQRKLQRITFDVSGADDPEAMHLAALEQIKREACIHDENSDALAPIIEINLRGHLGFKGSLLNLNLLRDETQAHTRALHVMVKNQTVPVEYAVAAGLDANTTRHDRERRIIEDLVSRDNRFSTRATDIAALIIEAKRLALAQEAPEKIVDLIAARLDAETIDEAKIDDVKIDEAMMKKAAIDESKTGDHLTDEVITDELKTDDAMVDEPSADNVPPASDGVPANHTHPLISHLLNV